MSILNLEEFFMINCAISSFGLMIIGLSISTNSDNSIYNQDVSTSFLHLGLLLCLPSIGALIFTILARKGIMSRKWKKLLLTPLMLFLKIVPILMASLTLISLVVQCQDLATLINTENMNGPLAMMKVGMGCLLVFLYLMAFICWIFYFWFVTAFILTKLEMVFFNQSTPSTSPRSGDQEFVREQLAEMGANFPPSYDELFEKNMDEVDDNLPCYEVACETETQAAAASNDGNDTPSIEETVDDTSTPQPSIDEIRNGIQSSDPHKQLQATQSARKILSRERNPPIDVMINLGILPRLVEFLSHADAPALQFEVKE